MPHSNKEIVDLAVRHKAIKKEQSGLALALLDNLARDFGEFSYDGGRRIWPLNAVALLLLSKTEGAQQSNFAETPERAGIGGVFDALVDRKMKDEGLSFREAYIETSREHPELSMELIFSH